LNADDKATAVGYFIQAREFLKAGNTGEAERLLLDSLEFYPRYSEPSYLLAKIYCDKQETTKKGLDYLDKSIKDNSWNITDPSEALSELGKYDVLVRNYKDAFRILSGLLSLRPDDSRVYLYYAKALQGLGDGRGFERALMEGMRRFPTIRDFYILAAEHFLRAGKKLDAAGTINSGISELPNDTYLVYIKSKTAASVSEQKTQLAKYFQSRGNEAEAYSFALSLNLTPASKYIKGFIDAGGLGYADLLENAYSALVKSKESTSQLDSADASYSGDRIVDADRDGRYEEKYTIRSGSIIAFAKDNNQDGIPELVLTFANRVPKDVRLIDPKGLEIECSYSIYPGIKSVVFHSSDNGLRKYNLISYAYNLRAMENNTDNQGMLKGPVFRIISNKPVAAPGETFIKGISFSTENVTSSGTGLPKITEILAGKAVATKIDENMNGEYDHVITYSNGIPVSGKRDLDDDGIYETQEYYSAGKLAKIASDENGDGKPDFIELFRIDGSPYELQWDYTYDGVMDAIELINAGNTVVYKFSTRFNGEFNLVMTFRNGILSSMQRDGRSVAIYSGKTPNVFWIGNPAKDVQIPQGSRSGKIVINQREYFLFNYKNKLYVEEM
jgi:tetratricopeptide (TPR) repeat protein